jgi:hypothetical protein
MLLENYLSGYDIAEIRESEAGYNYFGFTRSDGSWRILREKTDGTEYRLAIGREDFETNFTARATLTYKTTNNWPRL